MKMQLNKEEKQAILKAAIEVIRSDKVTHKEEFKFLTNLAISFDFNAEEVIGSFLFSDQEMSRAINGMTLEKKFKMLDIVIHAVVADEDISLAEVLVTKRFEDFLGVTVAQMNKLKAVTDS